MQDIVDIKFSKSELNSLAKTKGTCVTLDKKTRVVFLLPSQLSDIKTGIKENLDSNLLKYDYETKAIIIGYEKIKILSKYGSICYGYSKIALRIEVSLYLFKPAVGKILQGVVCKQSGRHLGCLVHKGFNVSIPLEDEDACGWDFSIGQDVKFTVVKLDLTSGPLPYIRGQLYTDGADCRAVTRDLGSKATEDEADGEVVFDDGEEDGTSDNDCGVTVVDRMLDVIPPEGDHHRWGYREGPVADWHQPEGGGGGGIVSPPGQRPEGGGGEKEEVEEGDGRNSLISQLLKTVERSIAEEGLSQELMVKKIKLKREPQSPARKGSKAPSNIPSSTPARKEAEPLVGDGAPLPVTPPPSGGKGRNSGRRSVDKKGAGGKDDAGQQDGSSRGGGGDNSATDSGSIIDRLLEMSRRELLGAGGGGGSPRGKKRKAEEAAPGMGEEGGASRKKISRKGETTTGGALSKVVVIKGEHDSSIGTSSATDPSIRSIGASVGSHLPSEKSVPSKTRSKPSQPKGGQAESLPRVLGRPSLSGSLDVSLPSRVKRKSLLASLQTIKQEK